MKPASLGERRPTRQIHVGSVAVGGGAPVTVQSMTITKTADVEGTLQQIYGLAAAGCDIVRCTCNEAEAAEGLAQIVPRSPVPIIADIHHQYRMALAALEAGVHGLRLNPGNIRRPEHIKAVAVRGPRPAGADPHRCQRWVARPGVVRALRRGHPGGDGRLGAAGDGVLRRGRLRPRQDLGQGIERAADGRGLPPAVGGDRPPLAPRRHRGRTAAGRSGQGDGRDRDAAARGHRRHDPLLAHRRPGRGGAGRPATARVARPARAQERRPDRLPVVRAGRDRRDRRGQTGDGCVRRAGAAAAGRGDGVRRQRSWRGPRGRPRDRGREQRGHLFVKGRNIAVVPEDEMVDSLVEWAEFINEHGVEAAITKADTPAPSARPPATAPPCSTPRARTSTTPPRRSSRSARPSAADASLHPRVSRHRRVSGQGRPRRKPSDQPGGDVGGDAGRDVEAVSRRQVAGARRRVVTTSSCPVASWVVGPARRSSRIDVPADGYSVRRRHDRVGERRRVEHGEQVVDVDRLRRSVRRARRCRWRPSARCRRRRGRRGGSRRPSWIACPGASRTRLSSKRGRDARVARVRGRRAV